MKALWCDTAALALVAAVGLSPAMTQGPKPSGGGNTWTGISQRVLPSSSTAEECGSGRHWVLPGYAPGGQWPPTHCASNAQVSAQTGLKSSYAQRYPGPSIAGGSFK